MFNALSSPASVQGRRPPRRVDSYQPVCERTVRRRCVEWAPSWEVCALWEPCPALHDFQHHAETSKGSLRQQDHRARICTRSSQIVLHEGEWWVKLVFSLVSIILTQWETDVVAHAVQLTKAYHFMFRANAQLAHSALGTLVRGGQGTQQGLTFEQWTEQCQRCAMPPWYQLSCCQCRWQ